MHIGILCPLDRRLGDAVHDPIAFHIQELEIRLRDDGHRVMRIGPELLIRPGNDNGPDAAYTRLLMVLASNDIDVVHDASLSATPWPASLSLPVPSVCVTDEDGLRRGGVSMAHWAKQVDAQTGRLLWLGGLAPAHGVLAALKAARLVERPILLAGPVLDRPWFDAVVRPKMGRHAWHVGALNRSDVAALLCCSAVLIHSNTRPALLRPAVCMSVASGTPVVAARTADLAEWFHPEFGRLTDTPQPAALADAIEGVVHLSRARCVQAAEQHFSSDRQGWLARYAAALNPPAAQGDTRRRAR